MPSLFVPEEQLGAATAGASTIRSPCGRRSTTACDEAGYGYWGFSPSNTPEGGYARLRRRRRSGWTPTATRPTRTTRWSTTASPAARAATPQPDPPPSAYTNGVVTPHAAFLALRYAPAAALADLARLARDFPGLYGKWGFRDSVNVDTGTVSGSYLSLDQGMIMAALGNALGGDVLRARVRRPRRRARAAAGDRRRAVRRERRRRARPRVRDRGGRRRLGGSVAPRQRSHQARTAIASRYVASIATGPPAGSRLAPAASASRSTSIAARVAASRPAAARSVGP